MRTCAQDIYVLKKSIDLSRVWTREPLISKRSRYPETTEADKKLGWFGSRQDHCVCSIELSDFKCKWVTNSGVYASNVRYSVNIPVFLLHVSGFRDIPCVRIPVMQTQLQKHTTVYKSLQSGPDKHQGTSNCRLVFNTAYMRDKVITNCVRICARVQLYEQFFYCQCCTHCG